MSTEIVRKIEGMSGEACLVKRDHDYFVVSSIPVAPDHGGPETLAFASDEEGTITSWADVAGGRGWSREQTIEELDHLGPRPEAVGRGVFADTKNLEERDLGETLDGVLSSMQTILKGDANER